jgi:hypothetical protein
MREVGEVMTLPNLRKSSSRMLKVIGGEWHKKDPIPLAFGEDYFMSRLARDLIFSIREKHWCYYDSSDGKGPSGFCVEEAEGYAMAGGPTT